jgi:hypothetical protein
MKTQLKMFKNEYYNMWKFWLRIATWVLWDLKKKRIFFQAWITVLLRRPKNYQVYVRTVRLSILYCNYEAFLHNKQWLISLAVQFLNKPFWLIRDWY